MRDESTRRWMRGGRARRPFPLILRRRRILRLMNEIEEMRKVDAARWRVAIALTATMMVLYFGFILLIAYNKPLLATLLTPGLSLGMLSGALVIVAAWVLIWIYVRWANLHYDAAVDA